VSHDVYQARTLFSCRWIIAPTGLDQVRISFSEFQLENAYDFVRVSQTSDLSCTSIKEIARMTGTYTSVQSFTSTTGYVHVSFTSDASQTSNGFTAAWAPTSIVRLQMSLVYSFQSPVMVSCTHTII
jgi:hypothetical protein